MRRLVGIAMVVLVSLSAMAGKKDSGTTTLTDVQPVGVTDKHHKNQQYDLLFNSSTGLNYTCRTPDNKKIDAVDFVVGSQVTYNINGNKGKVKNAQGKQLNCTVVRVATAADTAAGAK